MILGYINKYLEITDLNRSVKKNLNIQYTDYNQFDHTMGCLLNEYNTEIKHGNEKVNFHAINKQIVYHNFRVN